MKKIIIKFLLTVTTACLGGICVAASFTSSKHIRNNANTLISTGSIKYVCYYKYIYRHGYATFYCKDCSILRNCMGLGPGYCSSNTDNTEIISGEVSPISQ